MSRSMIFERDVEIPTREGGALRANVYRPVDGGPYPVILTHGPYGKDRHWADRDQQHARDLGGGPFVNWETPDPETWVPKGYAVVRVDGRGSGASPGELQPFSDRAARDYYDAIEWAGVQSWSTGKVGLLGISFYAMTQWPVAALRPPHLAAMVPWEAAADLYRDFFRAGGIANDSFLSWWWPATVLNVRNSTDESPDVLPIPSLIDAVIEHPLPGELAGYWQPDLANIDVPLLSVGNWGNIGLHLRGNLEAYLAAGSSKKWLRVVTGDHIHPFYAPENVALQERFLGHFLKGEDNGWESEPPVVLAIRDGNEISWRAEQEWPLARTRWTPMYLDAASRTLSLSEPAGDFDLTYSAAEDTVLFSTQPFATTTEVTGPLALRVWLSSSTEDADVFVRIGRVEPDGEEIWAAGPQENDVSLTQGWLRASHRKLDEQRSLPYRPFHTHDEPQPLEPGTPVALDIEIWPTSMVYPVGTRLIVEVGGHELTHSHFVHENALDRPPAIFGAKNSLHTGPQHPSFLLLPVIPADGDSR